VNARVYVLLSVKEGKAEQAIQTLRSKTGVQLLDVLEGPPDVIMMIQARERRRLAELTVEALASVGDVTEDLKLLPTSDKCSTLMLTKALRTKRIDQRRLTQA
jgi:hypothetical protein